LVEAQRAAEEAERKRIEEERRKAEEEEKRLAEEEAKREEARAAKREKERVRHANVLNYMISSAHLQFTIAQEGTAS
jgi:membrane protein involved in colicin uptake